MPATGPIYHYDGKNPSRIKLPPHFEGQWFITDAFQKWIKVVTLDPQLTQATSAIDAFPGLTYASTSAYSMLSMEFGPDGALYVSENESKVTFRVEYTGSCLPDVTPIAIGSVHFAGAARGEGVLLSPMGAKRSVALGRGVAGFALFDMGGRKVWDYRRDGALEPASVEVPDGLGEGAVLRAIIQN